MKPMSHKAPGSFKDDLQQIVKIDSAQMDFKTLLLVLCIAFASVQGATPPCCITTAPVGPRVMKKVEKFTIQKPNGRCDIEALVLHVKGKRFCAPKWQLTLLQRMMPTLTGQNNF